jgi:hypothetical protein
VREFPNARVRGIGHDELELFVLKRIYGRLTIGGQFLYRGGSIGGIGRASEVAVERGFLEIQNGHLPNKGPELHRMGNDARTPSYGGTF